MVRFLVVLAVFLIAHVIPAMPATRRRLQARLGEAGFIAAYSALSLGLFAWLIREALLAPYVPLWFAGNWGFWAALLLVPLALALLGAGALAPNPLSIAFVTREYEPRVPGPVAVTRHPILWGLGLWGLAHLPANGHLVGLVLFGSLGAFAFLGLAIVEGRRRAALGPDRWAELAAGTSVVPFAALLAGRARWPRDPRTLLGALAGLVAAALLLLAGGHLRLFQRDPLAFL
jgi:uncharacterized membrane protein